MATWRKALQRFIAGVDAGFAGGLLEAPRLLFLGYSAVRVIWEERGAVEREEWRKFNLALFWPRELAA